MGLTRLIAARGSSKVLCTVHDTTPMAQQNSFSTCSATLAPGAVQLLLKPASFNNLTSRAGLWKLPYNALASVSSSVTRLHPSPFLHEHTSHDLLCTLAVFGASFVWIRLFDYLVAKNVLEQGLSRKLVHITTGLIYALLWPLFSTSPWSRYFALAIPFANAVRLLVYGLGIVKDQALVTSMSRSGSSRELLGGPFYYVIVLAVCTVFFWRDSPVGIVALAIMCGGDGIADIMGRRLGHIKLPYNSCKSWAGSLSMFSFGFALSISLLYFYSSLGFYSLNWSTAVQTVALICLVATVIESLPISKHFDDNMSVPLVSLLLGSALFPGVVL